MNNKIKQNSVPLYAQIEDDLRHKIFAEEWIINEKIPTEEELCLMYSVSRITIRKAIENLVDDGLLYRLRAKGTFINDWIKEEDKDSYTIIKSFTNEMREIGKVAVSIDVNVNIIKANKKLAHFLKISEHDQVLELKRLRGYEDKVIAYFISYIPFNKNFSINPIDYYDSFYDYLSKHNIYFTQQKEYIESTLPTPSIQRILDIGAYEPLLKRVRMSADSTSSFNEYSECYYIGHMYRYYIEL